MIKKKMEEANFSFLNNYFWFDWECKLVRRNVRRFLKKYRRSLLADDRGAFCLARREYKHLLKKKKKIFIIFFWTNWFHQWKIRKTFGNLYISPKRKSVYNNISLDSWFQHFRALLEKEVDFDFDDENAVQDNESSLNRPISKKSCLHSESWRIKKKQLDQTE